MSMFEVCEVCAPYDNTKKKLTFTSGVYMCHTCAKADFMRYLIDINK